MAESSHSSQVSSPIESDTASSVFAGTESNFGDESINITAEKSLYFTETVEGVEVEVSKVDLKVSQVN